MLMIKAQTLAVVSFRNIKRTMAPARGKKISVLKIG